MKTALTVEKPVLAKMSIPAEEAPGAGIWTRDPTAEFELSEVVSIST
jgi:hypothetical protein